VTTTFVFKILQNLLLSKADLVSIFSIYLPRHKYMVSFSSRTRAFFVYEHMRWRISYGVSFWHDFMYQEISLRCLFTLPFRFFFLFTGFHSPLAVWELYTPYITIRGSVVESLTLTSSESMLKLPFYNPTAKFF